jgi:hypothetical protein
MDTYLSVKNDFAIGVQQEVAKTFLLLFSEKIMIILTFPLANF